MPFYRYFEMLNPFSVLLRKAMEPYSVAFFWTRTRYPYLI